MKTLIIADVVHNNIHPSTMACITAAKRLSQEITVLVCGPREAAEAASTCAGVTQVIHNAAPCYEHALAENMASLIAVVGKDYDYLIMPANTQGKNILPRVSGLLNRPMISDITQIIDALTFERPIYAGNAMLTLQAAQTPLVMTIRATAFEMHIPKQNPCGIENNDAAFDVGLSEFVSLERPTGDMIDLTTADIVVSGGRGLKSKENFNIIFDLAKKLHAAVGASRAAVDAGFVSNDCQVGQTGKIVAPKLYIAIGISGAIQHLAGMKESKVIVAINKDPDAPIFKVADYGLVGDLFEVVPALEKAMEKQ